MEQFIQFFLSEYGDLLSKLLLALLLGSAVGLERTIAGKQAGMRTYALVTMGSCVFVLISEALRPLYASYPGYNPIFMVSQIIVGIGFIGAGLIIFQGQNVHGLTTAAGLWVSAGIGIAVGYGLAQLALLSSLFTLGIFSVMWRIERLISPATVPFPSVHTRKRKKTTE
jgi:putative Mg2+ transporter-C (MgtC) family protein